MTVRPIRRSTLRLAGAGAAGLATVLAAAPAASAKAPVATSTAAPKPKTTGGTTKTARPAVRPAATTSTQTVAPDYGFQKYRVGVQIASGAYVPPGTTTVGSQITVTETDASVAGGSPYTFTCTTDASTVQPGSTASYCLANSELPPLYRSAKPLVRKAAIRPHAVSETDEYYLAAPGYAITARQTTVEPNLVIDPNPQTLEPCPAAPNSGGICYDANGDPKSTTLLFTDTGIPPVAKDDSATVRSGDTVTIDVLANDDPKAPVTKLSVSSAPQHGTAKVDSKKIDYTPKPGFVGTDRFEYTLTTANGTATAQVTVNVTAPPPTANDDTAQTLMATPVTINVLKNDDANGGGPLTLKSVGAPAHGTTRIVDGRVLYTPDAGYVGEDHFTYTASTDFGSDQARVTVTVAAAPTTPPTTPLPTTAPPTSAPPLANTGTPSGPLLETGAGLLLAGGAVTVAGRRRRGRHS